MTAYYVSNSATNGFVVGSDANDGLLPTTPKLTIAAAITTATHGDSITVNDGTYAQAGTSLTINKNLTLSAYSALGVTITGSNATAPVVIAAANDANTLTLGAFVISPIGGIAGSCSRGISISNIVGYDATVVLSGTQPYTGVNSAINNAMDRGTTRYENLVGRGNMGAQGWLRDIAGAPTAAKKVYVTGCDVDVTVTTSGTWPIWVERINTTPQIMWANVTNNTISVTCPASLGTSASCAGIYVKGISYGTDLSGNTNRPLIISGNTVVMTAKANTAGATEGIYVFSLNTTANAHGAIVRNNTVTMNTPVGAGIRIGANTIVTCYNDYPQVYQNTIYGVYTDGSASPHSLVLGNITNGGIAWGNYIYGGGVGILSSVNVNVLICGNIVRGAQYSSLYAKGNTNAFFIGNTAIVDATPIGARVGNFGALAAEVQVATPNTATLFANNLVYNLSDATMPYVVVAVGQTATFTGNNYYSAVSLSAASPWGYQGVGYATLGLWQAARETLATSTDPGFINPPTTWAPTVYDLRPSAGSALTGQPTYVSNVPIYALDYRGRARKFPTNVGAYDSSSGDPLNSARSPRT